MEKEVKINEKTYTVKEIKYKQLASLNANKEEMAKELMKLSSGITDEEYDELSMRDGIAIQTVINELNGFNEDVDFQKPLSK